jgi:hypothetical protein
VFAGALAPALGDGECVLDPAPAEELAPALAPPLAPWPEAAPLAPCPEAAPLAPWPEAAPLAPWPEAAPLAELADVGGVWVPSSEDVVEECEHPASATVRMAKTPKLLMAGFALRTVPAMVTRTVM